MKSTLLLAGTALLASTSTTLAYDLVKTYAGDTFFDHFTYFGAADNMTSGDVIFANRSTADNSRLTYINDAGNAIIRVDNTTFVPYNEKRDSIMLISNDKYKLGTVWVMDATHVPSGCSVWGALWSRGAYANWPGGGEIDIFEGINLQTNNQMALHTLPGCNQASGVTQTGTTGLTDCGYQANGGAGCTVHDNSAASYGQAFAAAGGGVWVTEFASTGINIWFFSRPDVPQALSGNTLNIADLGTPTASYPASGCDPAQYFSEQEIIIDITLCGTWAGIPSILEQTCPALQGDLTCYTTYVIDNKSTYQDAWFEIPSIKIFANSPSDVIETTPTGSTTSGASTRTSTATGGGGSSAGIAIFESLHGGLIVSMAFALFGAAFALA